MNSSESAENKGVVILFVDDDEKIVDINSSRLEFVGYTVEAYLGSVEALEVFKKNPNKFNAVITDQSMPELTGTELANEIHRVRPEIPVIISSGLASTPNGVDLESMENCSFLQKPTMKEDLYEILEKVLKK